jgi:hypothetical protein
MTWLLGKLVALGFESIEVDFESQAWWLTPVILVAWWGEKGAGVGGKGGGGDRGEK